MFRPDPDPIKIRIGTYTKNEYGTEIMRKPVPVLGWAKKNPAIWRSFFLLLFWSQGRLPALPNILQYYTMILPRIRIIEDPDLSDDYRYL